MMHASGKLSLLLVCLPVLTSCECRALIDSLSEEEDDRAGLSLLHRQAHAQRASARSNASASAIETASANATDDRTWPASFIDLSESQKPKKAAKAARAARAARENAWQLAFGSVFLAITVSSFSMSRNDAQKTTSSIRRRTEPADGVGWAIQTCLFLLHAGKQPLDMSGAFLVVTGASWCAQEKKAVASLQDYVRSVSICLVRLLPMYWIAVSVVFALNLRLEYDIPFNPLLQLLAMPVSKPGRFFAVDAWTADYSSYWFVSTLMFVAFAFPIINLGLVRIGLRSNVKACVVVLFVCYLLQWVFSVVILATPDMPSYDAYPGYPAYVRELGVYTTSFYTNPIVRLPEFVIGMAVSYALQALVEKEEATGSVNSNVRRTLAFLVDISAFFLVVLMVAGHSLLETSPQLERHVRVIFCMNLVSPLWALVIIGSSSGDPPEMQASLVKRFLHLKPVRVMGEASYCFFLCHIFILLANGCWSATTWQKCANGHVLVSYAYSMCLALTSYRFIEEPLTSFYRNSITPATAPTAVRL
mmetsp:Transcript_129746/g.225451  ORF Transcript_129746/g.225451 Transcript_129746/m.225451 type:complete len:532 (+) Transcript_129746:101-1696(+)